MTQLASITDGIVRAVRSFPLYLIRTEWLKMRPSRVTGPLLSLAVIISIFAAGCTSGSSTDKTAPPAESAPEKVSSLEGRLIKQPGDSAEEGKVYVVKGGKRRWIVHGSWIAARASEFPAGVEVLSSSDVLAVPLDDPITDEK